jgi:hypothetical protein
MKYFIIRNSLGSTRVSNYFARVLAEWTGKTLLVGVGSKETCPEIKVEF